MEAEKVDINRHYTKEEYFDLLRDSLHKYDYLGGRVKMMAGGTAAHADIIDNTFVALRTADHSCRVKSGETAIAVSAANRYFFPDISAVCAESVEYEPGGGIAKLTNPSLIIEVLSKDTAEYDRSEKFVTYRKLASFREYILIDSRKYSIESYYRESNDLWRIGSYHKLEQQLPIYTLGIEVALTTIYDGVLLEEISFDGPA